MEAIQIPMYRTSDGALFDDQLKARAHEAELIERDAIEAYVTHSSTNDKGQQRLRTTLLGFVKWRAVNPGAQAPAAEQTA